MKVLPQVEPSFSRNSHMPRSSWSSISASPPAITARNTLLVVMVRIGLILQRPRDGQRKDHILIVHDPDPAAETARFRVLAAKDVRHVASQHRPELLLEPPFVRVAAARRGGEPGTAKTNRTEKGTENVASHDISSRVGVERQTQSARVALRGGRDIVETQTSVQNLISPWNRQTGACEHRRDAKDAEGRTVCFVCGGQAALGARPLELSHGLVQRHQVLGRRSAWTLWTVLKTNPPPAPKMSIRSRTSRRTSSGVPKGSVFCVSTPPPQKRDPVAEPVLQRPRVHAGRRALHRVEDVEARVDDVGQQGDRPSRTSG